MRADKISVLVADNHNIFRKGLAALLEHVDDIEIVGEANNGEEVIYLAHKLGPDIIIMDVTLPLLNGIDASRKILLENHQQKILILSSYANDTYIEKVLDLGLSGYLVKQCSPESFFEALHCIAKGEVYFGPSILRRIKQMREMHVDLRGRIGQKKCNVLTSRETEVLQLIAEGEGNKQIAHHLGVSIKTVEKHRQNLMRKLCIHDVAGLTRYAISEGIIENSCQNMYTSSFEKVPVNKNFTFR